MAPAAIGRPATAEAPTPAAAAARLMAAHRIWLGTHVDPDGDAIGSLLGLRHLLEAAGHVVTAACQDPPPGDVAFLPGAADLVATPPDPARHDLAVALDAADAERLGRLHDPAVWSRLPTLVLDHHASNPGFGELNLILPGLSSTAEVVVRVAEAAGWTPGADAATCLLTGIVTDTLGFRTTSTTPDTLAAAGRLMARGAPLAEICARVFNARPLGALQLIGRALDRLEVRGPFAVTRLSLADFEELGVGESEARGIASFLATAAEPLAVAVLRERADGAVDVSMRARPGFDLVPVARALGGGGHAPAAGARVADTLEGAAKRVLAALEAGRRAATAGPAA